VVTGTTFRCFAILFCFVRFASAAQQPKNIEQQFQSAVAQYDAGRFPQAVAQLEQILPEAAESFEVHELLGLAYSAESQDTKANVHLDKAVHLKPNSAAARTNLGANLLRLGQLDLAREQFRKAAELEPQNFDVYHNLGEIYIRARNVGEATPFLEKAQQINPAAYDNGYDLSLAYLLTDRFADARQEVVALLKIRDTAELHNLLGEIEEKDGKFIPAEKQFELAAHMDPSESNLFDWGSELLVHRTLEPAVSVFENAIQRYPDSPRMAIGLGMALYALGKYDDAVKALLHASDLAPSDPRCYPFLSKAYDSSPSQAGDVVQRFRRFAELQPRNGQALYYYALSLWKGKRVEDPELDLAQIESLLKQSIALDPKLADAHLQLGNLYADQKRYADAIPEYRRALALEPDSADTHYRLGQAYVRTGETQKGQKELEVYQTLRAEHLADLDRQKAEIRQFVYAAKDSPVGKP